jgi:hypothetical protein
MDKKCVYINLSCGLGNRLFKIASAYGISKSQNKDYAININRKTKHNTIDYNTTIFKNVQFKQLDEQPHEKIYETEKDETKYMEIPNTNTNILLYGYFQNEKYFINYKQDIYNLFKMENERRNDLNAKYKNLHTTYAIHVRRGDYVLTENHMHYIDYTKYYENCFELFPKDSAYLLFSDDIDYCKNLEIFKNKNITYVIENELNSLYLMSMCELGCIACNSSFSWWGSYLNENPHKRVTFPNKWFNNDWIVDIYWSGSIIVPII